MNQPMRVLISSPPDRGNLVAELFCGHQQWAELNQEGEHLQLEIYPNPSAKFWQLDYEEVVRTLNEAKERLLGK